MLFKCLSFLFTLLNILSYAWSVIGVFKTIQNVNVPKQALLKISSIITWLCIIYYHINTDSITEIYVANCIIQLILLLVFWKTSAIVKRNSFTVVFSNDIPDQLIKDGMYKYVRHPFYTIYIICYFSAFMTTKSSVVAICFLVMLCIYCYAARSEEKKFATSRLSTQYKQYKSEAGMFWPRFRKS